MIELMAAKLNEPAGRPMDSPTVESTASNVALLVEQLDLHRLVSMKLEQQLHCPGVRYFQPHLLLLQCLGQDCQPKLCKDTQLADYQIDLRYVNPDEGGLEVVVAPVMRFKDIDFNANVRIEDIAPPDRIISGFALEIFGAPLAEGDVLQEEVEKRDDGLTYYNWELKPHKLVTATAVKNRLILMSITANPRQYRKSQDKLRHMWKSLEIVSPETAKPF
ncbi:hypothetical protein ABBQ32_008404 [Trebouxia sp. C0010 RCD-2024]